MITLVLAALLVSQEVAAEPIAPAAPAPSTPALLYAPPGCLDRSTSRFDLKHKLSMSGLPGFRFVAVTLGAFSRGGRILFPMSDDGDPSEVRAFLAARPDQSVERTNTVAINVVVTPWEVAFTTMAPDALQKLVAFEPPGTVMWQAAHLSTLVAGGAKRVRALEIDVAEPWSNNVDEWVRQPLATEAITGPDGKEASLFFSGRRAGTAASVASTLTSFTSGGGSGHGPSPLLMAGGIDALATPHRADCLARIKSAGVVASGVRAEDLALGVAELRTLANAKENGERVPYVAANLRDAAGERVVPGHVMLDVDGAKVAVIGLVDPRALAAVPASVASTWSVLPPAASLEEARDAARQSGAAAIVVVAPVDALATDLSATRGIDVAIGDFAAVELRASEEVARRTLAAHDDQPASTLFNVRGSMVSVGRVSLTLAGGRVVGVEHEARPASPHAFAVSDGPVVVPSTFGVDPYFARAAPNGGIAFPDLALVVARAPEDLRPLVSGDVLVRGRVRHIKNSEPARFTDPLWGRFIGRIARDELGADIAVVRNMQRRDDVAGPLTRPVVEGWIPPGERVRLVDVRGDKLARLVEVLRVQQTDRGVPASDLLFTSGLSVAPKGPASVRGRPVENARYYTVAITESALALPAVAAAFADVKLDDADTGAKPLRDVAVPPLMQLAEGGFDDGKLDALAALLRDDAKVKPAMWSIRFDDLSASGSGYANAPGIGRFATSRETRAATPNLMALLLNADVSVPYDADGFAWENRARLQYNGLYVFAVPNAPPIVQEQLDDIVLSTEVRIGPYAPAEFLPLFPFARVAFDTEHTASVVRAPPDPTVPTTLPHQFLFQESLGVALRPQGSWLKDARLGLLLQEDLSLGVFYDAGLIGGVSLAFPIGPALLTSENEVRYLFPDGDDRFEDLGLRLRSVERVKVQVTDELGVFVFMDLFGLTSKSFDAASGSVIVGAGVSFARIFPL